jgi:hypothetical protein
VENVENWGQISLKFGDICGVFQSFRLKFRVVEKSFLHRVLPSIYKGSPVF